MVKVGETLSVSTSSSSSLYESEAEELQKMSLEPPRAKPKKRLSKQLSMLETKRDKAWERRRRQMLHHLEMKQINEGGDINDLTDEDLSELKGSIELGFGFNEEQGQQLTTTLPALDLYFAVNRQISPVSTPSSGGSSSSRLTSLGERSSSFGSPMSDSDGLKFMSPGDNPQQVKTRLRHWAQAVACSVIQYN
ncbi:1-phosphatidylinositol-4,5-bisphosphate phosphodiesterase epsilon-1 [Hirschfeldia incana]|nr:1-phosphatidylinositol-4,5-bisphosphate phosphodiesterase epsilon-1 [Hirschfeldia incana]